MPSRKSSQWQSRRKPSLGKLRRAHPASGATWNVQVVRGKMTSKCLWHACRALALGMVLMLLGAGMATIGYYADQLSVGQEIRGNATVRVKNESRGFHLNNLSYVGPIIMGFGGFIVVAACVMTFEARDSAAKVVPARFKLTNNIRSNNSSVSSTRRANGIMHQSSRWDHHLGVFRSSPAEPPQPTHVDRQALTAALIHFSKTMGNSPRQSPKANGKLSRSGSVPNLTGFNNHHHHRSSAISSHQLSPYRKQLLIGHNSSTHQHYHHHHHHSRHLSKSRSSRISSSLVNRASRESTNSLLHPGMLYLQRHAVSVDESDPFRNPPDSPHDSYASIGASVAADSHEGRRDRTKRSDTAKRHVLARQKPIEKEEPHSPKLIYPEERRRSSTASDASCASRWNYRRTSSASRTPSIDSRSVQVELHSPEKYRPSPRTPRRFNSGQSSTPSIELRSQLSVCSEPVTIRQLSGQSSLEPCVLEESPELEDKECAGELSPTAVTSATVQHINKNLTNSSLLAQNKNSIPNTPSPRSLRKPRPESLVLELSSNDTNSGSKMVTTTVVETKKLQRSVSSRTFYRPKRSRITNEYEPIYFISANGNRRDPNDDLYDSLKVINERRIKILKSESNNSETSLNYCVQQPIAEAEVATLGTTATTAETTTIGTAATSSQSKDTTIVQENHSSDKASEKIQENPSINSRTINDIKITEVEETEIEVDNVSINAITIEMPSSLEITTTTTVENISRVENLTDNNVSSTITINNISPVNGNSAENCDKILQECSTVAIVEDTTNQVASNLHQNLNQTKSGEFFITLEPSVLPQFTPLQPPQLPHQKHQQGHQQEMK